MATRARESSIYWYAFANQSNVILLGGAVLFSAAVGSVIPLLVGLGGELLWLALGAPTARFRRWVAIQERNRSRERWAAQVAATVVKVPVEAATRVRALGAALTDVAVLAAERPRLAARLLGEHGKLTQLIDRHAYIVGVHHRLAQLLGPNRGAAVEEEIARLGHQSAEERDPGVRVMLRQALGLAQRRLKQREQVEATRRALDLKLATLEGSADLLRLQMSGGSPDEEILAAVEEVLSAGQLAPAVEAEATAVIARGRVTAIMETVDPAAVAAGRF